MVTVMHLDTACWSEKDGKILPRYPAALPDAALPAAPDQCWYRFEHSHLVGYAPVAQASNARLGTLYLQSDLTAVYGTPRLAGGISALERGVSLLAAYLPSANHPGTGSRAILDPAHTSKRVSA